MEENKEEKMTESTQGEQIEGLAEESVVEQPKQKRNDREYNKVVIDSMSELIDRKLEGCKTGLPMILTIVTSVIAFLFAAKFENDKILFGFAIVAMIALLIAFVSLLVASFPKASNVPGGRCFINKKYDDKHFEPSDTSTYIKMGSNQFVKALSKFLDSDLTDDEKQKALFLKSKANEYNYKKAWLSVAYWILIGGAVLLAFTFLYGLFAL